MQEQRSVDVDNLLARLSLVSLRACALGDALVQELKGARLWDIWTYAADVALDQAWEPTMERQGIRRSDVPDHPWVGRGFRAARLRIFTRVVREHDWCGLCGAIGAGTMYDGTYEVCARCGTN